MARCERIRRGVPLQHAGRCGCRCWPNNPTSSSSPPAACRTPRCCRRQRAGGVELGHPVAAMSSPGRNVLLFDDAGDHPALQAAEVIAAQRRPRRGHDARPQLRARGDGDEPGALHAQPAEDDVTFTVTFRLESVQRDGDGLLAIVGSDYGGVRQERRIDQVVVNHGTRPLDELYELALQPDRRPAPGPPAAGSQRRCGGLPGGCWRASACSRAAGQTDGRTCQLFRIGDATASCRRATPMRRSTKGAVCRVNPCALREGQGTIFAQDLDRRPAAVPGLARNW
jgi:hypothetical protein